MNSFITQQHNSNLLQWRVFVTGSALLASLCLSAAMVYAEEDQSETSNASPGQRLEQMKSQGPNATLTILQVRVAGKPMDRLTELIGLLLEQKGLQNIELEDNPFNPGQTGDAKQLAVDLGNFVQRNPIATDYALYVDYNVKLPQGQLMGIRSVFLDKQGNVVWSENLKSEDEVLKTLQAHRELMSLSADVVDRLAPQLGLNEQTAQAAQPGKMARLMDQRSGLPPQEERDALPAREEAMRKAGPTRTMVVLPPRSLGRPTDLEIAKALAKHLSDATLCQSIPAEEVVEFKASQRDPNELKVLWDFAREVREHARQHSPDADYVLCADYVFNPQNWEQGFVHFVVCDRQGEWVLVDMQNSHHQDYQTIQPTSQDDCDRLLVKRLERRLQNFEALGSH